MDTHDLTPEPGVDELDLETLEAASGGTAVAGAQSVAASADARARYRDAVVGQCVCHPGWSGDSK